MTRMETALALMRALPTWCLLVGKDRRIIDCNRIAEENGSRAGLPCHAAIAERSEACTWCCDLEALLEKEDALQSCAVELGYQEGTGFVAEKGGMIRDAHWVRVDSCCFLHFGFLGLCSLEDQQKALRMIAEFSGAPVPAHTVRCIEATSRQFFSPGGQRE